MSKKLAVNTTIAGTTYPAGSVPPADVAKLITNPKCWEGDPAEAGPPPMSGKGSGVKAWADYAAANDVEVPEDADRDAIVQALVDAGVPVE
jgi:hypothetical protein